MGQEFARLCTQYLQLVHRVALNKPLVSRVRFPGIFCNRLSYSKKTCPHLFSGYSVQCFCMHWLLIARNFSTSSSLRGSPPVEGSRTSSTSLQNEWRTSFPAATSHLEFDGLLKCVGVGVSRRFNDQETFEQCVSCTLTATVNSVIPHRCTSS